MSRFLILTFFLITLLNIAGCKSTGYLLVPNENQSVIYSKGFPYVSNETNGIKVTIAPIQEIRDNRILMIVAVNNNSSSQITISPDNFLVSTTKGDGFIMTYQQLKSEIDSKVFWQSFSAGLSRASESYANQSNGYSYSSGSVYGNNQYYTYSGYNYDANKVAQAQKYSDEKLQTQMDNIQRFKGNEMASIDSILRRETIVPGENKVFTLILELKDPIPEETLSLSMINNTDEIGFKFIVTKPK